MNFLQELHPDARAALPRIITNLKHLDGESWAVGDALKRMMESEDDGCCHEPHRVFVDDKLRQFNHDGTVEEVNREDLANYVKASPGFMEGIRAGVAALRAGKLTLWEDEEQDTEVTA